MKDYEELKEFFGGRMSGNYIKLKEEEELTFTVLSDGFLIFKGGSGKEDVFGNVGGKFDKVELLVDVDGEEKALYIHKNLGRKMVDYLSAHKLPLEGSRWHVKRGKGASFDTNYEFVNYIETEGEKVKEKPAKVKAEKETEVTIDDQALEFLAKLDGMPVYVEGIDIYLRSKLGLTKGSAKECRTRLFEAGKLESKDGFLFVHKGA